MIYTNAKKHPRSIELFRKAMRSRIKNIEFQNNLVAMHNRRAIRNEIERLEGELTRVAPGLREVLIDTRQGLKAKLQENLT